MELGQMGILGNMKWYTCILAINKMNRLEFELKYIFFKKFTCTDFCLLINFEKFQKM